MYNNITFKVFHFNMLIAYAYIGLFYIYSYMCIDKDALF